MTGLEPFFLATVTSSTTVATALSIMTHAAMIGYSRSEHEDDEVGAVCERIVEVGTGEGRHNIDP
jgi:hypothetical protein